MVVMFQGLLLIWGFYRLGSGFFEFALIAFAIILLDGASAFMIREKAKHWWRFENRCME